MTSGVAGHVGRNAETWTYSCATYRAKRMPGKYQYSTTAPSSGADRFYNNEYIRGKEHVHRNATKWPSLTESIKIIIEQTSVWLRRMRRTVDASHEDIQACGQKRDVR
jgi:hypothetical protein